MPTVHAITQAIKNLPHAELTEFRRWFAEFDESAWDTQTEADAVSGKLVFADDQPNAFALPGGKVGVNTGILTVAHTPDQLAAVIGHEPSHVTYQHGGQRVSTQLALEAAGQAGQILMARAGCNPAEAACLWQNMLALSDGAPPQWLSTHPNSEKRMEKLAAQAAELQALAETARSQGKGQACPR